MMNCRARSDGTPKPMPISNQEAGCPYPTYRTSSRKANWTIPGTVRTRGVVRRGRRRINDGSFANTMPFQPRRHALGGYSAKAHNNGAASSFADGHSALHKWMQPETSTIGRLKTKSKDPVAHLRPGPSLDGPTTLHCEVWHALPYVRN